MREQKCADGYASEGSERPIPKYDFGQYHFRGFCFHLCSSLYCLNFLHFSYKQKKSSTLELSKFCWTSVVLHLFYLTIYKTSVLLQPQFCHTPGYSGSDKFIQYLQMKRSWTDNWTIYVLVTIQRVWSISTSFICKRSAGLGKKQITSNPNDLILILSYTFW